MDKGERECIILDIAVKEKEKLEKCQDLKRKIKRLQNMKSEIVVPVIMESFGNMPKKLNERLNKPDNRLNTALVQKTQNYQEQPRY